jgi:hypothetical protein
VIKGLGLACHRSFRFAWDDDLPDGQITRIPVHPSFQKFSPCPDGQIIFKTSRRPAPTRGAYRDRHGRWARDAMDEGRAADECVALGRQSRVVPVPPIFEVLQSSPRFFRNFKNRKRHWNQNCCCLGFPKFVKVRRESRTNFGKRAADAATLASSS